VSLGWLGSADFIEEVQRQLRIGDRQISFRNHSTLGGSSYAEVYVNFINLPRSIGGAGGGAEAENNRSSFWVRGFDRSDPHAPPPRGKVKIEMANSTLPREIRLRGKTGTPQQVARYLADFLNRVVREVPPRLTHSSPDSSPGGTGSLRDVRRRRTKPVHALETRLARRRRRARRR